MDNNIATVVYVVGLGKFMGREGNRWRQECLWGEDQAIEAMAQTLIDYGGLTPAVAYETARGRLKKERSYPRVSGLDIIPGQPALYRNEQGMWANQWVAPTLAPEPGPYPTVDRMLSWLTANDTAGKEWLLDWIALKVQNPGLMMKTAVVLSGKPGAGKNTLSFIVQQILGPKNCAEITRANFENRFNGRWAEKLFVFADEIMNRENMRDVSATLKIRITSREVEIEKKGKDQYSRPNRMAMIIASNDDTPVYVERDDRRYTVFTNAEKVTPEYRDALLALFHNNEPTAGFLQEIKGFWAYLLTRVVDPEHVAKPYDNPARRALIRAGANSTDAFMWEIEEKGWDRFLEQMPRSYDEALDDKDASADFGQLGIDKAYLYAVYKRYCKHHSSGMRQRRTFEAAVTNHRPAWRHGVTKDGRDTWLVPRVPVLDIATDSVS